MNKSVKRSLDAYIRQMDRIDLRVIACVILLSVFGLIMIYSASAYSCSTLAKYNYDSLYLLKKQGIFVLAGIVVMLLLQYFNYNYLQKLAPIIFLVSVGSLFLLRTGLAVRSHGAARWIRLGPVQLQVAELVKIAMVIMIAAFGKVTAGMDIVDKICQSVQPIDNNGTVPADQQPKITAIKVID